MLVRTETLQKKQDGISFLLVDMKTPGITVRPIISINGSHSLNEVFFDDVIVPAESMLGNPGQAWEIITYALTVERVGKVFTFSLFAALNPTTD